MSAMVERLRETIRLNGPMPFAVFMEEALYGEGGYYNREDVAIGERGDFITGSSLSPLFGRTTARLLDRLDGVLGQPADLMEAGYGSGAHLRAVAAAAGGSRHLYGWDRVARPLGKSIESLTVPEGAGTPLSGLLFSYELFDALPVHRLVGRQDGTVGELWVALGEDGEFNWQPGELSQPGLDELLHGASLVEGQVADLAPGWVPLYKRLAATLSRGLIVTCDYGFERPALLDTRIRPHGTLACYRNHRVHRDALRDPGEQDLTAHVDFTALREAGEREGLKTVVLTRQARWLTALGIFAEIEADGEAERRQAAALLDGAGMGDEIRVLVQARDIEPGEVLELAVLGV
jgi:SAM-dependent MidA family methyltransferase